MRKNAKEENEKFAARIVNKALQTKIENEKIQGLEPGGKIFMNVMNPEMQNSTKQRRRNRNIVVNQILSLFSIPQESE